MECFNWLQLFVAPFVSGLAGPPGRILSVHEHRRSTVKSLNCIANLSSDEHVKGFVQIYNDTARDRLAACSLTSKITSAFSLGRRASLGSNAADGQRYILDKIDPNPDYVPPKYPIVLCHGLSGFDTLLLIPSLRTLTKLFVTAISTNNSDHFLMGEDPSSATLATSTGQTTSPSDSLEKYIVQIEYWIGVKEMLERNGCTVITTRVPSFGSIEERAMALHKFLETTSAKLTKQIEQSKTNSDPNEAVGSSEKVKLNLIAHSMGGLDSRYLISKIPKNDKHYEVASLTTISTPHHGSEMADFVVNQFDNMKRKLNREEQLLPLCFYQLTTYYMKYFNEVVPDDPTVKYFSYGCYFQPKWYNVLSLSWKVIHDATNGEPNDGMVSVSSSCWGKYKGTLKNIDHMDVINWRNKLRDDINRVLNAKVAKSPVVDEGNIDILQFYLHITDTLAREGF